MAGVIAIRKLVFVSAVRSLEAAGSNLNTTTLNVDTGDFNSPALTKYLDSFEQLRQAMLLYKQLICEDAHTLTEISKKFDEFDDYLAGLWRKK